jgi:hypothetical protein
MRIVGIMEGRTLASSSLFYANFPIRNMILSA